MKILLVEDDASYAGEVVEELQQRLPSLEIEIIPTEQAFHSRFEAILSDPPDLIITDMLLRWSDHNTGEFAGPLGSPYRAGFRVIQALTERPNTAGIPVVIHSALQANDLQEYLAGCPENVFCTGKNLDIHALLLLVRSLLSASATGGEGMGGEAGKPIQPKKQMLFVSYSHRDKHWLEELQLTLKPLIRNEQVELWDDTKIKPGEKWKSDIRASLENASVAILLVSRYFFGSDFIDKNELPPLLEKATKDGVKIFPIAVGYSNYAQSPLAEYQSVNDPDHPLESLSPAELNKELVRIADVIRISIGG